jgi:hypothetical protein
MRIDLRDEEQCIIHTEYIRRHPLPEVILYAGRAFFLEAAEWYDHAIYREADTYTIEAAA